MKYQEQIVLKNGKTAILRNGEESDGSAVFEKLYQTHGETDYMLSYPDENSSDPVQKGQFLKQKAQSENEIEIIAMGTGNRQGADGSVYRMREESGIYPAGTNSGCGEY